ncbi:hypothetical protein P101A_46 [Propionibacterium phage P101A]|uniref:Uncharacterized protein n=1 Tax=Propionibacterium phage P101A TaxID=1229786 RepID=K4HMY2_9CAUD|nr:hypothetical protein D288_gp46 [Propionibacterium phage P101A]AFT97595.1 hypothetical protein P101A_46 [Propionibacterium phage P101A]
MSFSFDTAGGRCDLFHMPGGVREKETPPQTNKTAPRIEQQGKGKVFIPPTVSKPSEGQTRPVQG